MAMDRFRFPPMPNSPPQYDAQYIRQVLRTLEIYFSQLDSNTPNNAQKYTADTFVGGTFTGTNITATNITATNVTATNVNATTYVGGTFTGTNITGTNITGTNVNATAFIGGTFTGTNITGTKITGTTFVGGTFTGTNITGTNITGTNITGTNVSATSVSAINSSIGYERANSIQTNALTSYGHKNGRQVSDDIMVNNIYATTFYGDGEHVYTPYTVLQSSSSQTLSAVDVAVAVTYTTNDFPSTITIGSPTSRIVVAHEGIYQFTFSLQFTSDSTSTEFVNVWFRKNGTDIAASNSQFTMTARKSAGVLSGLIAVTPYMINLAANDYIEVMWNSSATTTSLAALSAVTYSAGVTPAIPATPSAIVVVQFISAKFPVTTYVAPLPVFGFGQIGNISVSTG